MTTYLLKRSFLLFALACVLFSCNIESTDSQDTLNSALSDTDVNNPNSFDGVLSPIENLPYSEISTSKYIIELERWDIPNNRKDPIKTTNNIQQAIDWAVNEGYGQVYLPKGHYLIGKYGNDIYQAGIELKSSMAFMLDKNAVLEMAPNNKWNYCAIAIKNKKHVIVSGGTILGDRDNHKYTPRDRDGSTSHDEGHLICVEGESEFVTIQNVTLGKANGDGVLIVGNGKGEEQKLREVTIKRNNFSNNRRQGISIVGGKDILIEDNEIHHTSGTSPQFGIDIEGAGRINKNIIIKRNYFHHNSGGDIVNTDGRQVLVEDNIMLQGENGKYIDGPLVYWKNADWIVKNNDITMTSVSVNNWNGIIMYSNDKAKTNPNTTYIENNTCNNCGFYMYKGADLVIKNNHLKNGHVVFDKMTNLILEDNKIEHSNKCWAYRFLEVSGSAKGNTYNGESFEIPLKSDEPWDGCWIN